MKRYFFWKKEIKNRHIICQQCGELRAIKVHHHDGDKNNDTEKNLILLCNPCYYYLTRIKKKTGRTNQQQEELKKRKVLDLITWIKQKKYYAKHKTLRKRIDAMEALLSQ